MNLQEAVKLRLKGYSLGQLKRHFNWTKEEFEAFRADEEERIIEAISMIERRGKGISHPEACKKVGLNYGTVQEYLKEGIYVDAYLMRPDTPLSAKGGLAR